MQPTSAREPLRTRRRMAAMGVGSLDFDLEQLSRFGCFPAQRGPVAPIVTMCGRPGTADTSSQPLSPPEPPRCAAVTTFHGLLTGAPAAPP